MSNSLSNSFSHVELNFSQTKCFEIKDHYVIISCLSLMISLKCNCWLRLSALFYLQNVSWGLPKEINKSDAEYMHIVAANSMKAAIFHFLSKSVPKSLQQCWWLCEAVLWHNSNLNVVLILA